MADLNFPTSPSLNDTYSFGGKTWVWNGVAWQLQNQGAINGLPIGNATPSTGTFTTLSATGNISAVGNISGNYFIGNGSLLTGINASGGGGTVYFQDTAPASPSSGDIWIVGNTAVQLIYFSDGTSSQWAEMEAFQTFTGSNVTNSPGGSIYQIQYNSGTGNFAGSSGLTFDGSTLAVDGAISASGNVISSGNVYVSGLVGAGQLSVSGNVTVGGNMTPVSNATQSLGNTTNFWKDLYLAGNSIYLGAATIAANATAVTITNPAGGTFAIQGASTALIASTVTATGNVVGGNITTAGQISTAGNITSAGNISGSYLLGNAYFVSGLSPTKIYNGTTEANIGTAGGNANISVGGVSNVAVFASTGLFVTGVVSASGNITGGNLSVGVGTATVGGIVNANANGVGNIGSQTTYFNTVFAQATSAQYADLAEFYEADAEYPPGTVLEFGGEREVTLATSGTAAVAGVVSTKPAYSMNAGCPGIPVSIALQGRVPCGVVGPVRKGDLMISAGNGLAKATKTPTFGQIIGKALENYSNAEPGVIEIAVGRL